MAHFATEDFKVKAWMCLKMAKGQKHSWGLLATVTMS